MVSNHKMNPSMAAAKVSQKRADELCDWIGDYAKERINSRLIDERRCVPPYIIMDLGNRGILGMQISEQYGGLALNNYDSMRVLEQLAAVDLTIATVVSANNTLGVRPIMGYATPEMCDELLPILARGRELAAFGMTEPGAGADIGKISTVAMPDANGGWRVRGMKRWNGFAWAGIINVFVRLIDSDSQRRGLTGFVMRQGTPGLRVGSESPTMGLHGIVQNAVYFEDAPVDLSNLLGERGGGAEAAEDAVLFARLGIGSVTVGGMKRCAQLMLRYATRRSVATGRLLDNPITLARLSNLVARIAVQETLLKLIATILDSGHSIPTEVAIIAKIAGSEYMWQAADDLVQLLGGRGYMENNIAPQILRDARVFRIAEGPNESLKVSLGRRVAHTEVLGDFLSKHLGAQKLAGQLREASEKIHARCQHLAAPFSDRVPAMAWAYSLIGEVAIHGLLLASAQQTASLNSSRQLAQGLQWIHFQFEQSIEKAINGTPDESNLLGVEDVTDLISGYTKTIDDIEQSLAGEDRELDALLRRSSSSDTSTNLKSDRALEISVQLAPAMQAPASEPAKVSQHGSIQTPESVQDWIANWLSRKLKIQVKSIEPSKAFADFGLDSMLAVELAHDLASWLSISLEATILWNFPTIESLAQHAIGIYGASASNVPSTPPKQQSSSEKTQRKPLQLHQDEPTEDVTNLDEISEDEIANLITEEIAKAKSLTDEIDVPTHKK